MTDRDNATEVPKSPEDTTSSIKFLSTLLPSIEWQQDLQTVYNLSPKKEAFYKRKAELFAQSSTVVVLTGMWGMGDSVISTRFAINLARQTDKQVICQVHPALIGFADQLNRAVPNLQIVQEVPQANLEDSDSFVLRFLTGGGRIHEAQRWASGNPQELTEHVNQKIAEGKTLDLEDLSLREPGPNEPFPEPQAPVQRKEGTYNTSYYLAGFVSQSIGVPVTPEDLQSTSIFTPTETEIREIPQDLDYVFIPDAKEFPDELDYRSNKSLDLRVWEIIFDRLPKESTVGIVMGVSHPDYCNAVIHVARKAGLSIELLDGSLPELSKKLLRAKKIVGMDSGTTHLSKDVQTAAAQFGRKIDLKPLFNEQLSHFDQYGIVDVKSFTYQTESRKMAEKVAEFILN